MTKKKSTTSAREPRHGIKVPSNFADLCGSESAFRYPAWIASWGATVALVYWLVGISQWLDVLLGSAIVTVTYLYGRARFNRFLFDIADDELVRVSALANQLERQVRELSNKLEDIEARI